jgi:ribonuclease P protein component
VSKGNKKYSLNKNEIIRRAPDISAIFQNGRFLRGRSFDVAFMNGAARRVAFAATKRIRTAVERNRIKRRLREAFRLEKENFQAPAHLVLIGHENILRARLDAVRAEMRSIATKIAAQALNESQRKETAAK